MQLSDKIVEYINPKTARIFTFSVIFFWILGFSLLILYTQPDTPGYTSNMGYDTYIYAEILQNTLHGEFMYSQTEKEVFGVKNDLGIHFRPIILIVIPFVAPFYNNMTAIGYAIRIIGVVVMGLALMLFFNISLSITESAVFSSAAVLYLAWDPYFSGEFLYGFHENYFLPVLILLFVYGFLKKNWFLFIAGLCLSLTVKENVGLITFLLSTAFLFDKTRRKFAWVAFIGSILGLILSILIIESFKANYSVVGYFDHLGNSNSEILQNVLKNPLSIFTSEHAERKLFYLRGMIFRFGGLYILSPSIAMASVPDLLGNWLSNLYAPVSTQWHYNHGISTIFAIAGLFGVQKIKRLVGERYKSCVEIILSLWIILPPIKWLLTYLF